MILIHICIFIGNTHPNKKLKLNVGGIANQLLLLLPAYEKIENLKISIVTKYSEYKPSTNKVRIYQIHKYNNLILDTIYFLLKSPLKIIKLHKKEPITIINIHNFTYFLLIPIIIKLIYKIPILMKIPLDFNSFLIDTYMQKENRIRIRIINYSWVKFFTKILIKKINFIRALNEKMYNDLIKLNFPQEKILKIPNGIKAKQFLGIRKELYQETHFGYVGRLIRFKNLRILLRAFYLYLSKYPSDQLFIYGTGPEKDWISQYIHNNKLENNVFLLGFVKDKTKIYSNINVLVDTALAQGISNSALEAMCTNTFVIASNVDGNRDLIEEKVTGLLFDPYNKNDLLKQLLYYKENSKVIQNIIKNAKEKILKRYDIDLITKEIYKFIVNRLSY